MVSRSRLPELIISGLLLTSYVTLNLQAAYLPSLGLNVLIPNMGIIVLFQKVEIKCKCIYVNSPNSVQKILAIFTHEMNTMLSFYIRKPNLGHWLIKIFSGAYEKIAILHCPIQRNEYQIIANWPNLVIHNYWIILGTHW